MSVTLEYIDNLHRKCQIFIHPDAKQEAVGPTVIALELM